MLNYPKAREAISRKLKNRKIVVGLILIFIISLIPTVFLIWGIDNSPTISNYSKTDISQNRTYFNISTERGVLYVASSTGQNAVVEFIENQAPVSGEKLLPEDFIENSNIVDIARDIDDKDQSNSSSTKEHYVLNQTIEGVEVYGASLIVHLQNGNEVYSTSGNITTRSDVTPKVIEEAEAVEKAVNEAIEEAGTNEIEIIENRVAILNFKVMGLAEDDTNHLVFIVQVDTYDHLFSKRYFVSLYNGEILYDENLVLEAKNRNVYDCGGSSNPQSCPVARSEGSPDPTGVNDINLLFDYMGLVYDYYFNNFGRDGLDGRGSPMEAYARINSWPRGGTLIPCATQGNAYRSSSGFLAFCPGTVTKDITAHEFGHGVVGSTVRLAQGYQYGALNESISDSFASALDGNWIMGDGSSLGVIRNMENPQLVRSHPDRIFSPNYDCVQEAVHTNAGVSNKAFFLMSEGGTFNECTVSGVGIERSQQILYKVLSSRYIPSTANFYDMYSGVNQACADLYGSGSDICNEVQKAYQATEMDQQPAGSARGASCTGQTRQPATCAGSPTGGSIPTPTPGPGTIPTATPTLLPGTTATVPPGTTATPTIPGVSTPTPTTSVFVPIGTPKPTPEQYFTCQPDPNCISGGNTIQLCPLVCTPR